VSGLVLSGTGTLLPADADGVVAARLALTLQERGEGTVRRLAMVELGADESSVLWTSEPLPSDAYEVTVVERAGALVAVVDSELRALDALTGDERWRTRLRDRLAPSCERCVAVVDDVVVARTDDAYVVAYDLASGEQRWERRLRSTIATMAVIGGGVVVVDDPENPSGRTAATLLDPATGRPLQATAPSCEPGDAKPWAIELAPSTPVLAVAGTDDAVAAFGFGATCVVRWHPASGEVRWSVEVPASGSFRDDDLLLGPEHLVLADGASALVSVALTDGAVRSLEVPPDTRAVPRAIVDDLLVATTATTRGTPRHGLAAWNLVSGGRRWAARPAPDAEPVSSRSSSSSDALFDGSPRSLLATGPGRMHLLVFDGADRTVTSYAIDLNTGATADVRPRGFDPDGIGTPLLAVEGVDGERAVVMIDSLVQAFPLDGRGSVVSFP
jgi:hypothetical protein